MMLRIFPIQVAHRGLIKQIHVQTNANLSPRYSLTENELIGGYLSNSITEHNLAIKNEDNDGTRNLAFSPDSESINHISTGMHSNRKRKNEDSSSFLTETVSHTIYIIPAILV